LNEINLPQKRGKAEKLTKKEPSGSSPKIRLKSLYDVVTK
jgi:hypothetical protein